MRFYLGLPALFVLLLNPTIIHADLFISPIGGTAYEDWTIVNYVDLDSSPDILDWRGGSYTYNGHKAIDYTLPNFAAMDRGVEVRAAQAGTVTEVHDGEYDRWSRVNPNPGNKANYVRIDHGDGVETRYYHLKKNSISVSVGQVVSAGQQIGLVGSSGNSSDPHLHFAVYSNGNVVETYQNPGAWWQTPLAYAGDVYGALDFGISDHVPSTEELVNRPADHDVFMLSDGAGQKAYSWVNLFGFKSGDDLDFYFFRPDGSEYAHWNWTTGQIRYGWWIAGIGLPNVPELGTWSLNAQRNGKVFFSDTFTVSTVPEPSSLGLFGFSAVLLVIGRRRRCRAR